MGFLSTFAAAIAKADAGDPSLPNEIEDHVLDVQVDQYCLTQPCVGLVGSAAIGDDRRGIADSITGRVERLGGIVVIDTAIGAGTEVELVLPWNGRRGVADDLPDGADVDGADARGAGKGGGAGPHEERER